MSERRKLLWHSVVPWAPTGFGVQTALFARALSRHYDVTVSAYGGLLGAPTKWDGLDVLPGGRCGDGHEPLARHVGKVGQPVQIMTLMDVWSLDPAVWAPHNVACWNPVHYDQLTRDDAVFFSQSGAVPIAMSRFGERVLADFDPLYCPHAVDLDAFAPRDRGEARAVLGIPDDRFVVGLVAGNGERPSRKMLPETLLALANLRARHDDAVIYLHSQVNPRAGEDLLEVCRQLNLPGDAVRVADQYRLQLDPLDSRTMSFVYSAMDVLANPSKAEGFGIPVLEAQACGTPVVVSNFSAMPELCGAGWLVDTEPEWMGAGWAGRPRVAGIAAALEHAYDQRGNTDLATQARGFATGYGLDTVLHEHMVPTLDAAWERNQARGKG